MNFSDKSFDQIFKYREFNELVGRNHRDLLLLSAIIFLTFFALGHVLGGKQELERRMSNPFTNWVNVPVISSNQHKLQLLEEDLSDQLVLDSFHISNIEPFQIYWLKAITSDFKNSKKVRARSISMEDPLRMGLMDENNSVWSDGNVEDDICQVIISESIMSSLGFDILDTEMVLPIYDNDYADEKLVMLLEISHVVKHLPNNADLLISNKLVTMMTGNIEKTGFIDQSMSSSLKFLSKEQLDNSAFEKLIKGIQIEKISKEKLTINLNEYVLNELQLSSEISFRTKLEIYRNHNLNEVHNYISHHCNSDIRSSISAYYYSVNFADLSRIKEFRDYFKDKFDVFISLAQVESRDNFYLISRLANMFIYLLVIFSSFSILLYLQNIIKNHLEKIKPNLGTLKAFGLSDNRIGKLYLNIVSVYFLRASAVAFIVLIIYKLLQVAFGWNLYFKLFDIRILLIWAVIFAALYFFFRSLVSKILFKSPGDLIYGR